MDATQVLLVEQLGGFLVTAAFVLGGLIALGFTPNRSMQWILIAIIVVAVAASVWNLNLMRLDVLACIQIAIHVAPRDPAHDSDLQVCLSAQHLHSMLQVAIAAVIGAAICGGLLSRPSTMAR